LNSDNPEVARLASMKACRVSTHDPLTHAQLQLQRGIRLFPD
jgi:hypothetical protein